MAISKKTFIGEAIETTPGAIIATPVRYIPCKSELEFIRKPIFAEEDRNTRDMNYSPFYGTRYGRMRLHGRFYTDSTPPLLWGFLGLPTSAQQGTTTAYRHTFNVVDVPPTFSVHKFYQTKSYVMPYGCVEKFTLRMNTEKMLEWEAQLVGKFPSVWTPTTATFTANVGLAGYLPTVTLNSAGGVTTDVTEFTLEMTAKIDPFFSASGSPDVTSFYFTSRDIKFNFVARFDGSYVMDRFVGGNSDTITVDVQGATIASTYNHELNFTLPNLIYDAVQIDQSKGNLLVKASATAYPDPTTATAIISGFVQNDQTSYTNG